MRKLRERDGQQQPVTFLRTALLKIGRSEGETKELAWCRCIRCVQVGEFAVSDSMNIMLRSLSVTHLKIVITKQKQPSRGGGDNGREQTCCRAAGSSSFQMAGAPYVKSFATVSSRGKIKQICCRDTVSRDCKHGTCWSSRRMPRGGSTSSRSASHATSTCPC